VFAERPPVKKLVPDAAILFIVRAETLTVGELAVPPVYVFRPDCTLVISFVSVVENMSYKLVEPEYNVPPLNDETNNDDPSPVPEKLKLLKEGEETILTIGLFAVPPVVMLEPGCMRVISFPSAVVKKIEYKSVPADKKVPELTEFVVMFPLKLIVMAEVVPEMAILEPAVIPETIAETVFAVRIEENLLKVLRFTPSCSNLASPRFIALPPLKFISDVYF
jgi:hypothetical protein